MTRGLRKVGCFQFSSDFTQHCPKMCQLLLVRVGVAEIEKFLVMRVVMWATEGMFNGAKVLLCPGRHLPYVGDQAVGIATVVAIEMFDPVQVRKMSTVKEDVTRTVNLGHLIDGKADRLVDPNPKVEKNEGDNE